MFDRVYKFDTLSVGFKKAPAWDENKNDLSDTEFSRIEKSIYFYNGDNERKTDEEIENDIKEKIRQYTNGH